MKLIIKKCKAIAILLGLSFTLGLASSSVLAQVTVLDLLNINSTINNLDPTISAFAKHYSLSAKDKNAVRRQLGSATVQKELNSYLRKNASENLLRQVSTLVEHPMAARVGRYQDKLAETSAKKIEKSVRRMKAMGLTAKRKDLIRRIDKVVRNAYLAAQFQTAVEAKVAAVAGQPISNAADRQKKRQASINARVNTLNEYVYRFFSDQELEGWVTRLEQKDVVEYAGLVQKGLAQATRP